MNGWHFRLVLLVAATGWGAATTATKYALAGFGPMTLLVVKLAPGDVSRYSGCSSPLSPTAGSPSG
jgi:hypothetical protein